MDPEYKKKRLRRIKNVILILLLLLLIGIPTFGYFKVASGGHMVLREAKNIKLAYQVLAVEYYGNNKSIYNPAKKNGMTDGVEEKLKEVTENEGNVFLQAYDKKNRTVMAFVYETKSYRVSYERDKDGNEQWKVDYFFTIQQYGGEQ